jgi:hypothetical protein
MGKIALIIGACASTTLLAAAANAGTLTATLGSVNPKTTNLTVSFTVSGTTTTRTGANVGEFNWTIDGPSAYPSPTINPGDPGYGQIAPGLAFQSFCIEGTQTVSTGGAYSYTLSTLTGANAEALTEFWGKNIGSVGSSSINAAAFQLGIWEIMYDYGTDGTKNLSGPGINNYNYAAVTTSIFTSGNFQVASGFITPTTDPAVSEAITMLHQVTGSYTASGFVLGTLTSGTNQDQLAAFNPPLGTPAVPLPAALPVGGAMLSLMGVVAGVRRRRNRA